MRELSASPYGPAASIFPAPPGFGYGVATVPDGMEGVEWTVRQLLAAIRGEPPFPPPSPRIRELVEDILAGGRGPSGSWPRTTYERILLIYQWYLNRLVIPQVRDRRRVEEIRGPEYMLSRIQRFGRAPADCDDTISLLGAMLEAIDIPIRLVLIGTYVSEKPQEYSHIYLKALSERGWRPLDPIHGAAEGWETQDRSIQKEVDV